jgi:hypothetical protein
MKRGESGRGSVCLILAAAVYPLFGASTPPFVQQGNQVTVAPTMPTYNGVFFNDDTAAYNVVLSPNGFSPLTLNNTDTVLEVGAGSSIVVQPNITLVNTSAGDDTVVIIGTNTSTTTNKLVNAGSILAPNGYAVDFDGFMAGTNVLVNSGTITGSS